VPEPLAETDDAGEGVDDPEADMRGLERMLGKERSTEVNMAAPPGPTQWTKYPTSDLSAPMKVEK